jgi:hypothetical protein
MLVGTVDQKDLIRLQAAIQRLAPVARDGLDGAIKRGIVFAAQSAAKATPAAKNRKYSKLDKTKRKKLDAPWWADYRMDWYNRDGQKTNKWLPNQYARDRLKVPKYKGAAKAGWWGGLRELGKATYKADWPVRRVSQNSSRLVQRKENGKLIGVSLRNKIKYIRAIAPDSAWIGVYSAANRMEGIESRKLEKKITAMWAKKA